MLLNTLYNQLWLAIFYYIYLSKYKMNRIKQLNPKHENKTTLNGI